MVTIEIRNLGGEVETRSLSKSQPLSIGKHASNDVAIDEDGVASMHCRISWNKDSFEIVAASAEGVEVNGTLVQHAAISVGDVIRIGGSDIKVCEDDDIGLEPVDEAEEIAARGDVDEEEADDDDGDDLMPSNYRDKNPAGDAVGAYAGKKNSATDSAPKRESSSADDWLDEDDWVDDADDADAEDVEDGDEEWLDEDDDLYEAEDAEDDAAGQPLIRRSTAYSGADLPEPEGEAELADGEKIPLKERLKALKGKPARPGEQDILRSPFVITLFGGSMVLLLLSGIFWFIIGRETAQRQFDAAQENLDNGKFRQAIRDFSDFLQQYPRHDLTDPARIALGHAKIRSQISGSTPDWQKGVDAVAEFRKTNQDLDSFQELKPEICKYGEQIALGAAASAEKTKQRDLLSVSNFGRKILERNSPSDEPPTEALKRIRAAYRQADAALRQHETSTAAIAKIDAAIKNKQPMVALDARRRLLEEYPVLKSDRQLAARLTAALNTEKELIKSQEPNREAIKSERTPPTPAALSLTAHARLLTSEKSDGRTVYVLGKDCCYGIDTVTGDPVWRRVIGLDPPFFPMRVETSVPGFLLFHANDKELLLVERRTGRLVWRQPLDEDISGAPLINQGQVYLPTLKGRLYKIDLETGRIAAQLSFSQKALAPPALVSGGKHLIVAGDMEVLYTLSIRPRLQCIGVTGFDFKPGSIEVPLMPMGKFLLLAENDRIKNCRLRVIDVSEPEERLQQIAEMRVTGQVRDTPVLRGPQLFVPSSEERISAFSVSDDEGQKALSHVASTQIQTQHSGAMYLSVGADGEFWMASNALRKFQLSAESIKLDPKEIAVGLSSQPLQSIGRHLYLGRRLAASGAVVFSQADRDKMSAQWRTVVGAGIVVCTPTGSDSIRCLTQAGDLFDVRVKDLQSGGFKMRADSQLKLPDPLADPLRAVALPDGRTAVYCGNPQPHLWLLNKLGLVDRDFELEAPLETDPVWLSGGIVLPLPGKLKMIDLGAGQKPVEDFLAPVQKNQDSKKQSQARWSFLVALDETHMIVADSNGKLANVQFRTQPVPHLKEIVPLPLENPIQVGFVVRAGKIIAADAGQRLQIINAADMQTQSQTQLAAPASNSLWLIGDNLYVETGRDQLHCFQVGQTLKQRWSTKLDGVALADRPLVSDNKLVLAKQDGEVLCLDPQTGDVKNRLKLGQPISLGPRQIGDLIVVASIDGSLHRVESVLQAGE